MTADEAFAHSRATGVAPTLVELGGTAGIRALLDTSSPGLDLPLFVPALTEAGISDAELAGRLADELRKCDDPATFGAAMVALPDTAGHIADGLVPALLERVRNGDTSAAAAHIAARAIVGATAVALASSRPLPAARVALELSDAAPSLSDVVASAAVRAAGALVDALPEDGAVREAIDSVLDGLADCQDTEVDVAMERAYLRLADALSEPDGVRVHQGLADARQRFDEVLTMDGDRIDAAIVACGLGAVAAFAAGEPLADRAARLEELCDERAMYGTGSGDQLSRRPAEDAWRLLAHRLAEAGQALGDTAWLDPIAALTLLTDAVRLSRAQRVGGANLGVLVTPRLRAPFVENEHLRTLLQRHIETLVDPACADLAAELLVAADEPPKADGSESADGLLRALHDIGLDAKQIEAVVAMRDALSGAVHIERGPQWWQACGRVAEALLMHPDQDTRGGRVATTVLVHILDFIAERFNLTRGRRPHLEYLTDPDALEQVLANDLVTHLRYWYGEGVRTEVPEIGGGRVNVVVDLGDDRIIIECKRDYDPWKAGTLEGWAMQADAYLATGSRIGFLVLLDLSDNSQGRPTDLAGSVRAITIGRTPVDHLVVCAVVPGNQTTPSSIGAAARSAERKAARSASTKLRK